MVLGDRSFDEGLGVECHPAVFFFSFWSALLGTRGSRFRTHGRRWVRCRASGKCTMCEFSINHVCA
jgi:hypothetical protein